MLKNAVGVELAANTILQKCGIELPEDRLKHESKNGWINFWEKKYWRNLRGDTKTIS